MESILTSIKKLLGITEDYEHFDEDLVIHINSAFSILHQLGLGPDDGFSISSKEDSWSDFIGDDNKRLNDVKTYIFIKVKLWFDPPLSTAVLESYKTLASELEWRLNVEIDPDDGD